MTNPSLLNSRIAGQPIVGQPIVGQPIVGQPIVGQPIVGQPIVGQSIVGQPIVGQPIVGQPIVGQPIVGQPIVGQPIVGQPIVGQPIVGQPIVGQLPGHHFIGQPLFGQLSGQQINNKPLFGHYISSGGLFSNGSVGKPSSIILGQQNQSTKSITMRGYSIQITDKYVKAFINIKGYGHNNVTVSVMNGNKIVVEGEQKMGDKDNYDMRKFKRVIQLPENSDMDKLAASATEGGSLLVITAPKKQPEIDGTTRKIPIKTTKLVTNTAQPLNKPQLNEKLGQLSGLLDDQTARIVAALDRDVLQQIDLAKQQSPGVNPKTDLPPKDLVNTETIDLESYEVNGVTVNVIDNKKIIVEMKSSATESTPIKSAKYKSTTTMVRDGFEIDTISASVIDNGKKLHIMWTEKPITKEVTKATIPVKITFNKLQK